MPQLTFERVEKKYLLTPAQLDALVLGLVCACLLYTSPSPRDRG